METMDRSEAKILKKAALQGHSLLRAMHTLSINGIRLEGRVIDLGAKSDNTSYIGYMDSKNALIDFVDKFSQDLEESFDLEEPMPIQDETYDSVLLMNVLEHIYNHQLLISEINRILKPGGRLIGFAPFLHPFHPDPEDHFRYTHSALERILTSAGMDNIEVSRVCEGRLCCVVHLATSRFPMPVLLRYWLYRFLSFWARRKRTERSSSNFYAGLNFQATSPVASVE